MPIKSQIDKTLFDQVAPYVITKLDHGWWVNQGLVLMNQWWDENLSKFKLDSNDVRLAPLEIVLTGMVHQIDILIEPKLQTEFTTEMVSLVDYIANQLTSRYNLDIHDKTGVRKDQLTTIVNNGPLTKAQIDEILKDPFTNSSGLTPMYYDAIMQLHLGEQFAIKTINQINP